VYKELKEEDSQFTKNNDFWLDMLNVLIGIIWQSSMILLPIYFVFRDYTKAGIVLMVFVITSLILKFTWLDRVRHIPN
jgi:hypothetical protein